MAFNLKGRSLLSLKEETPEEIRFLLDISHQVKKDRRAGVAHQRFLGKTLALIFEKRSTRTRCAFETAFGEEGGYPVFLSVDDIQLGAKESIEDTARVLGRMFDAIQFRGFKQETVDALARWSGVPVYNGLTDLYHPTQVLADLMTVEEAFGRLAGIRFVYAGDGRNNMANSLMIGCAKMGLHYVIAAPKSLWPAKELVKECQVWAKASGGSIAITDQMKDAVKGAEIIYTDVWASMGEESKAKERIQLLTPFQVNAKALAATGRRDTVFLHCLPAVKGQEVTADVLDGPQSRAWDEAENRKHTIKAVMLATI
ncbi:MAG TPA: ornithine carbamoyltransferase [Acidobacteriota bacterium]|jgi:ornithine carbamoyltransferase|nr:ornithine carbamoyltransferase [Acidobacteriota bacterium]HNR40090.1 ornithine carbamoyltransferase [Acidobacteriota bacterium]HNU00974.1 ornithine carbamoyltransferase [Acidobacteriota bacterium]HPB26747.1 ornithine carbamoyltransferase [Acidobacteriota bacterium]HQO26266.1 ornithine carbamoyltransferase [Acidobacteriota bacterium]